MSKEKDQALIEKFTELRDGYWNAILYTDISINIKRDLVLYFRAADKYVVECGGESVMESFDRKCVDYGYYLKTP